MQQPFEKFLSEGWEDSTFLDSGIKKFLEKLLKRKYLNAAILSYVKFRQAGETSGVAIHKAASMNGLGNDKLFSDIINDMIAAGLLTEAAIVSSGQDQEVIRLFNEFLQSQSVFPDL